MIRLPQDRYWLSALAASAGLAMWGLIGFTFAFLLALVPLSVAGREIAKAQRGGPERSID